jgi:hypothetical protein
VALSTGTQNVSDNKIIGTFAKGGSATASTATLYTSAGVHSAGSIVNHLNNDFSNITFTLNTIIAGWVVPVPETPPKLSPEIQQLDWWYGRRYGMSINGFGGTSSVSNNTISTISGQATITGLLIGAAGTATQHRFYQYN